MLLLRELVSTSPPVWPSPYSVDMEKNLMRNCRGLSISYTSGGKTRSSWLNCALRDDEAVYWVSIGHYEAVAVGN